jgi:hypothetical protein
MEGHLFLCISRELIKYNLQKYDNTPVDYRRHVINDIIFGKKKKIVAKFKDNLIYFDNKEFIKKYT